MPDQGGALAEQLLLQDGAPRRACGGKAVVLCILLIGVSLSARGPLEELAAQKPGISLAWQKLHLPLATGRHITPLAQATSQVRHFLQPPAPAKRWGPWHPVHEIASSALARGYQHVVRKDVTDSNNFKNGLTIEVEGSPCKIVDFQHVKPGKGAAFVRTKIKNLLTSSTRELTFRAGEKVDVADISNTEVQYTYEDGEEAVFMNMETYDEFRLKKEDSWFKFLKEGMTVRIVEWSGKVIDVRLEGTQSYEVAYTEPADKGNTASGGATKPATLDCGAEIAVPLFINIGEKINVDTATGTYLSRDNTK